MTDQPPKSYPDTDDPLALLADALEWLEAGQNGDPNGAKCYQAHKRVSDAIHALTWQMRNKKP